MAIRRCPYCKAIIDESQKYCNNCGTQLLFPQDDSIEEDIKGEKIRDDDFRDIESDEDEAGTSPGSSDRGDTRKEIDLGKILDGKASFPDDGSGGGVTEAPPASDEPIFKSASKRRAGSKPKFPSISEPESAPIPAAPPTPPPDRRNEPVRTNEAAAAGTEEDEDMTRAALDDREESLEETEETDALEAEPGITDEGEGTDAVDFIADETMGEEIFADEDIGGSAELKNEDRDEARPEVEPEAEPKAVEKTAEPASPASVAKIPSDRFDGELDGESKEIVADADREGPDAPADDDEDRDEAETREEIGRLIAALEKKNRIPPAPRAVKNAATPKKETSGLPAWAEPSPTAELPAMGGKDEVPAEDLGASFAPGDTMDFEEEVMRDADRKSTRPTIGIPETLSKIEIPGGAETELADLEQDDAGPAAWDGFDTETDGAGDQAGTGSAEDFVPRRRLGFFGILKAGIYDLFFVAILWFIAVWLAAEILSLPVKTLILRAAVPLGLLFGVLLIGYLFLFIFFLGETIGGRIAAAKR